MLLLLLSHVSRVRLCATPQTAAHQAPPGILQARTLEWVATSFSNGLQRTRLLCPWGFVYLLTVFKLGPASSRR